ncbi:MAG TPA: shikimate dehydrogenase [Hyphomicrobiales bacterium]|nr:shikimate dehydrogenase [Hyphomicrobiales bacterium]
MKRACVIGWPVAHSLSPVIHGFWLRKYRIAGEYVKAPVKPEDFEAFFTTLGCRGFCGANITVPHKLAAFRLCGRRDAAAEAIGAVNTVWIEDGGLAGSNTDALGFLANLDESVPYWDRNGTAAVIGAGGAARAVVWALVQRGFQDISIANRSRERAAELCAAFAVGKSFDLAAAGDALYGATLVINCTSLGMTGCDSLEIDLGPVAANAIVCDIVYDPLETALLRQAREKGLRAVDGLGMLLHQAVPGFEKWFGIRAEVTAELRSTVLAAIDARRSPLP